MWRQATKLLSSSSGFGPSTYSAEGAALPSSQKRGGSSLPFGVEANPPSLQKQLNPEPQKKARLEAAGVELSPVEDAPYARGIMTASARDAYASDLGSMQSDHGAQKRPAQGPLAALRGSRQGAKQLGGMGHVSAQRFSKGLVTAVTKSLNTLSARSRSESGKTAGHCDPTCDVHASSRGHTAVAHHQHDTRRTSAPRSTLKQLSASDLIQLPSHSEGRLSRPSSAGVTSPERSAMHMRYEPEPWHS